VSTIPSQRRGEGPGRNVKETAANAPSRLQRPPIFRRPVIFALTPGCSRGGSTSPGNRWVRQHASTSNGLPAIIRSPRPPDNCPTQSSESERQIVVQKPMLKNSVGPAWPMHGARNHGVRSGTVRMTAKAPQKKPAPKRNNYLFVLPQARTITSSQQLHIDQNVVPRFRDGSPPCFLLSINAASHALYTCSPGPPLDAPVPQHGNRKSTQKPQSTITAI